MFSWLLLLIQYGPGLISLIREIFKLFDDLTPDEKKAATQALKDAHADYKLFGDKKPMLDLRDRLKRKCDDRKGC